MPDTLIGAVPDKWEITTLGELCVSGGGDIQTGPFGSQLHASDYVPSGIPSVMPQNIGDNVILEQGIARITREDASRLSRYLLRTGDIVYSRRGDVERRAWVRAEQNGWLCGTGCLRVRLGTSADSRLISYYLGHPDVRAWIVQHAIGATMPNLNTDILGAVPVAVPSRSEQASIAKVLGTLDDKIAINDRIMEVSDELIRQNYTNVSANANEVVKVGDLAFQVHDIVPAEALTVKDSYIGLEHMPRRNIWLAQWKTAATVASAKTRFSRGDILFGKLRPYFHKVGITFVNGVSSTDILVIRPKRESVRGWVLAALSSDDFVAHASAIGDGTRMPRAKWSDLANYKIPWPGRDQTQEFNQLVMPLVDRIGSAVAENWTLAELRDTLLPRLMSGEIRVRDVEKVVEDVT